jgi:hypothetical protein
MATAETLFKTKVEYSFQSSSYSPTGGNDLSSGTPTVVDLSMGLTSGIADGSAMNSDQVDLGATRPDEFFVIAAIEWFAAVTAGKSVNFYWSPSGHSTVGTGNPGIPDGVDGDWTGDGGGTVAETVKQLIPIGKFIVTDLAGVQIAVVGSFRPMLRYGQLIIHNKSGTTLCGTDDIESSVLMSGIVPERQ